VCTRLHMLHIPLVARMQRNMYYIGFTSFLQDEAGGEIPQEPKWGTGCDSCQNSSTRYCKSIQLAPVIK
jgi:hypothetical protein